MVRTDYTHLGWDDDYTVIGDTSSGWYVTSYITYKPYHKKSLKEMMKIWADERSRELLIWPPLRIKPNKEIQLKPIPLRGVMLNGHGWANQK